ncbi:MAG: hypothetical protein JXP34_03685 [Planctomycetes bacterium]|nr:hypothetical protein [Planctomycetota bacterium]
MIAPVIALLISSFGSAPPPGYRTYAYPELTVAIRPGLRDAEADAARIRDRYLAARARSEARLGGGPSRPPLVVEAPDGAAFRRALASLAGAEPPAFAAAVAVPAAGTIVVDATAAGLLPPSDPLTVLAHEIAHLVVREIARGRELPRWFEEGVACWVAQRDPPWPEREDIAFLAWRDRLYRLDELQARFPRESHRIATIAYLQSHSFIRWLEDQGGAQSIRMVIARVGEGRAFGDAVASVYGRSLPGLFASFRDDLARSFRPLAWVIRSFSLFTLIALLAVVAILRHRVVRRRRLSLMEDGPDLEGASRQNGSHGLNSGSAAR